MPAFGLDDVGTLVGLALGEFDGRWEGDVVGRSEGRNVGSCARLCAKVSDLVCPTNNYVVESKTSNTNDKVKQT